MQSNRVVSLDVLRLLCAFGIVCLHFSSPSGWIEYFSRIAVPVFFMLSGYFSSFCNLQKVLKSIQKISIVFLLSSILYVILSFVNGDTNLTTKQILFFFLFNNIPFAYHLWYLPAYVYVLGLGILFERIKIWTIAYWAIPLLLIVNLVLGKYSMPILGYNHYSFLSRNFIFCGLPFFLIGKLIFLLRGSIGVMKNVSLSISFIVVLLLSFLEYYYVKSRALCGDGDLYISTIPLSIAVFILFLRLPSEKESFISKIGKNYSLYIYLLHPFIAVILGTASPVLIFASTLLAAFFLYNLIAKFLPFLLSHE